MTAETLPATAFKNPAILLSGVVDYDMYTKRVLPISSVART